MKRCSNCKNRLFKSWNGLDFCMGYEMTSSDEDEIKYATNCTNYNEGDPAFIEEERNKIYGPSNPWDAPGMRISDFI